MIDLNAFVQKWSGQDCKTGPYDDQCVNLVREWELENGWTMTYGNAIDYAKGQPGWTWHPNTPTNFPPPGAIAVFKVGIYGHVGIAMPGCNARNLILFEQNDPLGSYCHIHTYDYIRPQCLGYLTHN